MKIKYNENEVITDSLSHYGLVNHKHVPSGENPSPGKYCLCQWLAIVSTQAPQRAAPARPREGE